MTARRTYALLDAPPYDHERSCPSCHIRYRFGPPHEYLWLRMSRPTQLALQAAALEFDQTATEKGEWFSASQFVAWIWILPDCRDDDDA